MHKLVVASSTVAAFLLVAGCQAKLTGIGPGGSASAAAPAAACPDGSSGEGTVMSPCKAASPASRMMEVKWTGKIGSKGPIFSVKNNATRAISQGDVRVWFYDASGKQLDVAHMLGMGDRTFKYFWTSGAVFGDGINPGASAEVELGQGPAMFPAGAVNAEAEAVRVCFATGKPDWDCDVNWENPALKTDARAQLAAAPAGAQAFAGSGAAASASASAAPGAGAKPAAQAAGTAAAKTLVHTPPAPPRAPKTH